MAAVERRGWRDDRVSGARHLGVGIGVGAAAGGLLGSTAVATYLSVAGRCLGEVALDLGALLDAGDLDRARVEVRALVGRDTDRSTGSDLCRAVIESVAENTVDAVVAPALWGVVAGAPGTLAYRAVNTLDAMVGHRSARYERFGWASARADDLANWVLARATALLVAAA